MPIPPEPKIRIFKRDTVMTFGRHKGLKISTVLREDPGYIVWMSATIEDVVFEDGILEDAEDADRDDYGDPCYNDLIYGKY